MLKKSRSMSGLASPTGSTTSDDTQWSSPVLGDGYRCSRSTKTPFLENIKKSTNLPKTPRPVCAVQIFEAVKKGIKSCIQWAEDDVVRLRTSAIPVSSLSAAQHIELAERFKKRLESHLVRIEQLEENYVLNLQLWEGAKTMAKAYVSYGHRKSQSIDCGVKECVQNLCAIELSLEALLGSFDCTLKGLFGFARLMPGDVFEVVLRYGHQKWKSRGKIGVTNQSWDPCARKLKASISDRFSIKASEVKLFGKHIALGETICETMNLFSAKPCDMLINVNPSSSLRLGILVKWNPLEGVDESLHVPAEKVRVRSSPGRRLMPVKSMIEGDGQLDFWNVQMASTDSDSRYSDRKANRYSVPCFPLAYDVLSDASLSAKNFSSCPSSSEQTDDNVRFRQRRRLSLKSAANESSLHEAQRCSSGALDKIVEYSPKSNDQEDFLSNEAVKIKWRNMQKASYGSYQTSINELLQILRSKIERLKEKCDVVNDLEKEVIAVEQLIQKKNHRQDLERKSSDVSFEIENVLEAFSFLNSEDCVGAPNKRRQSHPGSHLDILGNSCDQSLELTTKTTDSGIESIVNHLEEDEVGFDVLAKMEFPTTGSRQVDAALNWHLSYCTSLLNNVDSEKSSQDEKMVCREKLRRQVVILSKLTSIAANSDQGPDIHQVLNDLTERSELQQFWLRCVDSCLLITSSENFLKQLYHLESDVMTEYMVSPKRVFDAVLSHILDSETSGDAALFETDFITLHQFMDFFTDKKIHSVLSYVLEVAGRCSMDEQ